MAAGRWHSPVGLCSDILGPSLCLAWPSGHSPRRAQHDTQCGRSSLPARQRHRFISWLHYFHTHNHPCICHCWASPIRNSMLALINMLMGIDKSQTSKKIFCETFCTLFRTLRYTIRFNMKPTTAEQPQMQSLGRRVGDRSKHIILEGQLVTQCALLGHMSFESQWP